MRKGDTTLYLKRKVHSGFRRGCVPTEAGVVACLAPDRRMSEPINHVNSQLLVTIARDLATRPKEVVLTGDRLTSGEVLAVARGKVKVRITDDPQVRDRIALCHAKMMEQLRQGVPIYGVNTGYGQQASHHVRDGTENAREWVGRALSEGICHVDVSVGPALPPALIRAAMLIRVNMLMHGSSAVKLDDLALVVRLLNLGITPVVNQFGGLGASGDLAHNSRVVSVLRQLNSADVWDRDGNIRSAKQVLSEAGIPPLVLDPKAGLGLCNGDNFSSSAAVLLAADTVDAFLLSVALSAMVTEVLLGTNRSVHPLLERARPHLGQREVAGMLRYLLDGSQLARQELSGHVAREEGVSVQDGYSLRGLSQYHAISAEKLHHIFSTLAININSVSDNPLWVPPDETTPGEEPWQWVSGANFLAAHAGEALDSLRQVMTRITKLHDRHLARMVTRHLNNGLPSNLSGPAAQSQCVFKGVQIQSGMFEVYSTLLSIPISTFFGVHEEGNQDITTHALTSAILGMENLRITRYALAQTLLAVAQAVDERGGPRLLATRTRSIYDMVRSLVAYVDVERPLHRSIETLYQAVERGDFGAVLRDAVFVDFSGEE